jgi:hypothetical protein
VALRAAEPAVWLRVREAAVWLRVREAAVWLRVREAAVWLRVREAAVSLRVREAAVCPLALRTDGGLRASAAAQATTACQRRSHASSARAAWPRCEIASFSASVSSAIVRPGASSGMNSGS